MGAGGGVYILHPSDGTSDIKQKHLIRRFAPQGRGSWSADG